MLDGIHEVWKVVAHVHPSPFPFTTKTGKVIVGETCDCGADRSQHLDTALFGHGGFPPTGCARFIWAAFRIGKPASRKSGAR